MLCVQGSSPPTQLVRMLQRHEYGARGERVSTDCKFIRSNRKGINEEE